MEPLSYVEVPMGARPLKSITRPDVIYVESVCLVKPLNDIEMPTATRHIERVAIVRPGIRRGERELPVKPLGYREMPAGACFMQGPATPIYVPVSRAAPQAEHSYAVSDAVQLQPREVAPPTVVG